MGSVGLPSVPHQEFFFRPNKLIKVVFQSLKNLPNGSQIWLKITVVRACMYFLTKNWVSLLRVCIEFVFF